MWRRLAETGTLAVALHWAGIGKGDDAEYCLVRREKPQLHSSATDQQAWSIGVASTGASAAANLTAGRAN
jgi:hypothetical protein